MDVVLMAAGMLTALAGLGGLVVLRGEPACPATQEALKGGALLVGLGMVLLLMGGMVG
jgi:hypothetical protein